MPLWEKPNLNLTKLSLTPRETISTSCFNRFTEQCPCSALVCSIRCFSVRQQHEENKMSHIPALEAATNVNQTLQLNLFLSVGTQYLCKPIKQTLTCILGEWIPWGHQAIRLKALQCNEENALRSNHIILNACKHFQQICPRLHPGYQVTQRDYTSSRFSTILLYYSICRFFYLYLFIFLNFKLYNGTTIFPTVQCVHCHHCVFPYNDQIWIWIQPITLNTLEWSRRQLCKHLESS